MHSELINQVKCMRELTYLRKDQPATTSQFFFFFFFLQHHAGKRQEAYPSMKHHVLGHGTHTNGFSKGLKPATI
jgi:hypothetical protein